MSTLWQVWVTNYHIPPLLHQTKQSLLPLITPKPTDPPPFSPSPSFFSPSISLPLWPIEGARAAAPAHHHHHQTISPSSLLFVDGLSNPHFLRLSLFLRSCIFSGEARVFRRVLGAANGGLLRSMVSHVCSSIFFIHSILSTSFPSLFLILVFYLA